MIAHWLPCKIDGDGIEADADRMLLEEAKSEGTCGFNGNEVLHATFRGRPIRGTRLELPDSYSTLTIRHPGHIGDHELEPAIVGSKLPEIILWNLSTKPGLTDEIPLSLLWLHLADIVHDQTDD